MWGDLNGSIIPKTAVPRGWEGRPPTRWAERGVSRRSFLKFCAAMTTVLALPDRYMPRVAAALERVHRPALVWLEFQDCAGCTESFLRASRPSVGDIALDILSVNYHETIMAPSGKAAEKSLMDTVRNEKGKYLVVVEGSIPTRDGGFVAADVYRPAGPGPFPALYAVSPSGKDNVGLPAIPAFRHR